MSSGDSKMLENATYNGLVWAMRGTHSKFLGDEQQQALRKYFPHAKIHPLDGGHSLMVDQPRRIRELLRDFLAIDDRSAGSAAATAATTTTTVAASPAHSEPR
jgi:hypothetical protein